MSGSPKQLFECWLLKSRGADSSLVSTQKAGVDYG